MFKDKSNIFSQVKLFTRTFVREFAFVYRFAPGYALLENIAQVLIGVLPAAELYVAARIIDELVMLSGSGEWSSSLTMFVVIELVLLGMQRLLFISSEYLQNVLRGILRVEVNDRIHQMVIKFDIPTLEKSSVYTLITYLKEQSWRPNQMVRATFQAVGNMVASLSFISIAFSFSPLYTLLFVIAIIPSMFISIRAIQKADEIAWGKAGLMKKVWYYESFFRKSSSLIELIVHNIAGHFANKAKNTLKSVVEKEIRIERFKAVSNTVANVLAFVVYVLVYIQIIVASLAAKITIGQFTLFAGAFVNLERFMVNQVWQISAILEHTKYLNAFHELEQIKSTITDSKDAIKIKGPISIEFRNVSFSYPGDKKPTVRNMSFHIRPGERVALVGENGAGKSTVVKLLMRLYEPSTGVIYINDRDYRDYSIESLRKIIGVTFQDFLRFSLTVKENIVLGELKYMNKKAPSVSAAKAAGIHEKIMTLPSDYKSELGHEIYSHGLELSGGEWQKLALARSLIKDASLLILDEPTAALDARSEFEFFEKLFDRIKDQSLLLISHRFSSVRFADNILVLKRGRLVEEGSHSELIKKKGLYAELYDLQTKDIL